MNLKEIGEFGLIKKLSDGCLIRNDHIIRAIGDDAAVFRHPAGEVVLVTTDMMVEQVHFVRNATSGFNLGYKTLSVNLSDIAAMGANAREAFVSIAIPKDCSIEFIEDVYRGMKHLAAGFQVNLLGGDTTRSYKDMVINVAIVGSAPENEILYRHGAKKGDVIFCTGTLGDSRAGCHLIVNEIAGDDDEVFNILKKAHLMPIPHIKEGRFFARCGKVHAAIDISDGLSSDLAHVLEQSRVGARIYAEKIPISLSLKRFCRRFEFDPIRYALAGGEDYSLLVTIAPDHAETIVEKYRQSFHKPLYEIGVVTDSNRFEMEFSDGRNEKINASGWDHFKQ